MTRILFATSELHPLVKTGGLADVSFSLPTALADLGLDVRIVLPAYASVLAQLPQWDLHELMTLNVSHESVKIWETTLPNSQVPLWLVDSPHFSQRAGNPYQSDEGTDWPDNAHRYYLFCQVASLLAMGETPITWAPDLVHCNDWQTGLIAAFLHDRINRPATVFTIHNIAYQGLFSPAQLEGLHFSEHFWRYVSLEFHGKISFIKGGLVYADQITTVSPGYTNEVQTQRFGCGLDGLLKYRRRNFHGILNGIDTQEWNPATDGHLRARYDWRTLDKKQGCKRELLHELGLANDSTDRPLLGFIGRLVEQKGVDLLVDNIAWLIQQGCQIAILGTGMPELERLLQRYASQFHENLSLTLGYNEGLAHRITAGSDIFLMPSRFEPCGLNQMYSLRYGTVPVVHKVGGLQDTVFDLKQAPEKANGFSFDSLSSRSFRRALERCLKTYQNPEQWRNLQTKGMAGDYSWRTRSHTYTAIYETALADG